MKRIVVGIDGSQSSIHAARFAGELAEATGAELVVIYVRAPSETPNGPMPPKMAAVRASYHRQRERRAHQQAAGALEGLGVSWSFLECMGDPAEQLEAVADEQHAELIVVGAHGLGAAEPLGAERLGWVSTRMAHHGHLPVLIVR
jgi:nucleotide-binding universal stress UspA family protein